MTLIERLVRVQEALDATDGEFGRRLGIDASMWNLVKNRKRNLGRASLRAIYEAFPELKDEIFEYTISEQSEHAAA